MALGICELVWIETVLKESQVEIKSLIRLYYHNKTAIRIAHNHVQHDRTKYILK